MTFPSQARSCVLACAAAGCAFLPIAGAWAQSASRVIELFTSQGCSSCPPADRLAEKLSREPGTVVLSLPVDYWDYIGWKDTFATSANTARQKAYALARGDGNVYTPQAVIDGLRHAVGSDPIEIDDATKLAALDPAAMKVSLTTQRANGRLVAEVDGGPANGPKWGAFWVFHVTKSRTVAIARGENAGHTVTYTNIVRSVEKVGNWMGQPARFEIDDTGLKGPDADGYVLILQASSGDKPGAILAAVKGPGL